MNQRFDNYVESFERSKKGINKKGSLVYMMRKYFQLLLGIYMGREAGNVLSSDIHSYNAPRLRRALFGTFLISNKDEDFLFAGLQKPVSNNILGIDICSVGVGSEIWHPGRLIDCMDKIVTRDKRWHFDEANHHAIYILPFSILWFINGNHSSCIGSLFSIHGLVYPREIMDLSGLVSKLDTNGKYFWDENRLISENPQPELAAIWKIYRNYLGYDDIPIPETENPQKPFLERVANKIARVKGMWL